MSDTILLLRLEHSNMARLLDWFEDQIRIMETGSSPDFGILDQALYYMQNYPDKCHHPKEDLVLDALRRCDPQSAASIGDLAEEHRKLAALTDRTAAAVGKTSSKAGNQPLAGLLRELVDSYRKHMEAEEKHFFPLAMGKLDRGDWESIDFELFDRDDPLFDHSSEEQFRKLREGIAVFSHRYVEINAAQKEIDRLQNLSGIDDFNLLLREAGSKLQLVGFTEGGYGLERHGKLITYIPSLDEIQAIWCAYYYAKGAEEITLA